MAKSEDADRDKRAEVGPELLVNEVEQLSYAALAF